MSAHTSQAVRLRSAVSKTANRYGAAVPTAPTSISAPRHPRHDPTFPAHRPVVPDGSVGCRCRNRAIGETCLSCGYFATDATHAAELRDQSAKTTALIELRRDQYRP